MMRQKGVFPYSYLDNSRKLEQEILLSKSEFYDNLNDEDISEAEYQRAKPIWKTFTCKNLGIRGGISQCSDRMHEANNKYLPNYNPSKESTFIAYIDVRNLYGHSMSSLLPTGNFEWMNEGEISASELENVEEHGEGGYVLEVDVWYRESLHDSHSDLPFLVERMIPPNAKTKIPKLIPNLYDKTSMLYIIACFNKP
ncbi:unnamed protein product [Acanthoscelides obtectus]|uniref:DNA-directed DNA polymerase n=1 Tax=Acanthoscelides obtectus TaxID=200917 RepID=A0A9P0LQU7_ACAOB|nr:unnamed protein product [Acanthoscelides obtectus]CAK1681293.1 hypothetical protein AOBTE_LOCUS33091 [Acanthoscelides obtectus]